MKKMILVIAAAALAVAVCTGETTTSDDSDISRYITKHRMVSRPWSKYTVSESTDLQKQLIEQLKALQTTTPAAQANPWQQQATPPTAAAQANGLSVPLKIDGVRVYLHFGAEAAASPQAIMQTIETLDSLGAPVDRWKPRQQWGGGNSGYNKNRW